MINLVDENGNPVSMRNFTPTPTPTVQHHYIPSVFAVVPPNPAPAPAPAPVSNHSYISVVDHQLPYDTHNVYDVVFHSHTISTLLTTAPSLVESWISETLHSNGNRFIVGLDVEWRPSFSNAQNPVATLQLCVGHRCLVFQIRHAPYVPHALVDLLGNANHTFVGVGIEEDVEKLLEDYSLGVANFVDLRKVAAERYGERQLKSAGLKTLSLRVLGLEVQKPRNITMSRWDNLWLTAKQVQYACVDAFVSYEVGRNLIGYYG